VIIGLAFAAPALALVVLLLLERVERGLDRARRDRHAEPGTPPLLTGGAIAPPVTGAT